MGYKPMNCKQEDGDRTWEKLKQQIARLAQMKNFPRGEPIAIRELVIALQWATSLEQAEGVITAILRDALTDTYCPMPAEIRRACKALQLDPQPDPLCQMCEGSGWRIIKRAGLSGANRCTCWAPREPAEWEHVPLHGSAHPAIERATKQLAMPKPKDEDLEAGRQLAGKIYGTPDEIA